MPAILPPLTDSGAHFSPCRVWRYRLWRTWDAARPHVVVIGLNPSTADEVRNDPTVRRCLGFAVDWGFGGLTMLNLFGLRSTDPKALYSAADPHGADNEAAIVAQARRATLTVCAWGVHGELLGRGAALRSLLQARGVQLHHLGLTRAGHPKHPLYLRGDTRPQLWAGPESKASG